MKHQSESKTNNNIPLQEMSPKDKPWNTRKGNANTVASYHHINGNLSYASRIYQCARELDFIAEPDTNQNIVLKLKNAKFCRVPFCPICEWRKSMRYKALTYKMLPKFLEDNPTVRLLFVTFTVRNCDEYNLKETVDDMNHAFRKLKQRSRYPGIGTIKCLEVTKGKDNRPHPHFHCLIAVKSTYFKGSHYLSKQKWIDLWKSVMGVDYEPWVWVRAIKQEDDLTKVIPELIKYTTKPSDLVNDPGWYQVLVDNLAGKRKFEKSGIFTKYFKGIENKAENLVGEDDEDNTSDDVIRFQWDGSTKQYLG